MQANHKYLNYSVENFINLIVEQELKKEELVTRIKALEASKKSISNTLQKVDFAIKRIDEPLENDVKYLLLVFPFGIVNRFNQEGFFNIEENRRLGFVKKIEEYHWYSSVGLIFYMAVIIVVITFF